MTRLTICILILVATGCAGTRREIITWRENGPVWPSPPDRTRVRYLGEISGELPQENPQSALNRMLFGPEGSPQLVTPQDVAVSDDGNRVAVADPNAGGVHILNLERNRYAFRPGEDDLENLFETPVAAAWLGETLYVADASGYVVVLPSTGTSRTFGRDQLTRPAGIAADATENRILVSDAGAHAVFTFSANGEFLGRFGERGTSPGHFNFPTHLTCAANRELWIADSLNFRVQRLSAEGEPIGTFGRKGDAGGDFALPKGIGIDGDGNIWVVDAQFENVQAFTPDGKLLLAFGEEGTKPGEFWLPAGMAIDRLNRMWIADSYNRRVQVFEILR